jgi:thiamine biosynthesis protein ThiS
MPVSVIIGCNQQVVESGKTVFEVLNQFKVNPLTVAVQLNSKMLKNDLYPSTVLKDGDILECLVYCAGG